jgi:peroxiredoxin Q/BCP
MLSLGKKPKLTFKVDTFVDGKAVNASFASLLDGPTIVSVYMRNNTSACDKQAAEMDKNEKAIVRQGFRLIAVSRDTCASHAKYAAKHGYKFTLVSDPDDLFSQAMDAIVEKSMYGKKYLGPLRAAYLFDGDGKAHRRRPQGRGRRARQAAAGRDRRGEVSGRRDRRRGNRRLNHRR